MLNPVSNDVRSGAWRGGDGHGKRGLSDHLVVIVAVALDASAGWCIRVRNRMGVTCEDVLFAIFDFFASP